MSKYGKDSTAEEVSEGINLDRKVVIVTGASSGLGEETARVFALRGALVVIAVRNVASGEKTAQTILSQNPSANLKVMEVDLASLKSIRKFAADFKALNLPLNYLINNAGIMALPERKTTEDGFELQFGTNHLGHFLLTNLLADVLIKSAPARVVTVSSLAHAFNDGKGFYFEDYNLEHNYSKWAAYAHSKTANILFSNELNERLKKHNVESFSLHPGGIRTPLQKELTLDEMIAHGWLDKDGNPKPDIWKTIPAGAATSVFAATSSELTGKGGAYLEDCNITQTGTENSRDPENGRKLWALSEKLVGQTFSY
ncbi:short-chain dehydrogenase [Acrasis kona]|uniref:Short-chain dehydrogenase n=1 Tax=Acrasis kona TaxID=1008807 RepID=A0AAW2YVT6_9EUKA